MSKMLASEDYNAQVVKEEERKDDNANHYQRSTCLPYLPR